MCVLCLLSLHWFELCVQVKNESDISAMDISHCAAASEQTPLTQQHSSRKVVATTFDDRHSKTMSVFASEVTHLGAGNPVCLSPLDTDTGSAAHWLNRSLPAQSRCRVYSEDGTPAGSTCLRRGRPNSLKSGLPSPLQRSLLVSAGPVSGAKDVAVIDTSPILSTYSVTSAVRESSEHTATVPDRDALVLVHSEFKGSLNTQIETALDDSTHNQAFTESMLADPNSVDTSLVDATDASDGDTEDCDKDVTTSGEKLSSRLLSQSLVVRLSNPAVPSCSDPVQSSTTSLDSAIDAENMMMSESQLECEVNIPRSFSKQSIISHDSGVVLADPQHSADIVSPKIDAACISREESHDNGLSTRQSGRFSPNLQVSTDVRKFLSKSGMPSRAVSDMENEIHDSSLIQPVSECERVLESHTSQLSFVNLPSSTAVSRRQSKLVPVLPISTNLLRVSAEQYSGSATRCVSNSSAAASPAVFARAPQIKSALLTPSFKQCLSGADGTSQLRSRFRGKPVKRLQSSPYPNHSPVNPLSPGRVATAGHATVAVPFDIDV